MKAIQRLLVTAILTSGLLVRLSYGQTGNDNPTGAAGEFNGQVTTGCSYDPYTGSAKRSVTDIVVAGGVGTYPLAFTRTSNSRYTMGLDDSGNGLNSDFGGAGNWLHSYQWAIDAKGRQTSYGKPKSFTVRYPDGRVVKFGSSANGDPYFRGGPGVRDRLQVFWDSSTAGRAYLIMPDGGKVYFTISITYSGTNGSWAYYTYQAQSISDPYGQTTTISGSPATGLVTITEPAGRWLKLYYTTITDSTNGFVSDVVINQVAASDGRSVQYSYVAYNGNTALDNVTYYGDPTLVASYTYQDDNTTGGGGDPLLATCIDPMYAGPMWKIGYKFATGLNADGTTSAVYGQLLSENYFDGSTVGAAISTLSVNNTNKTRTETRGDGKTRTFTYGTTPLLTGWTDFKGNSASQTYDSNGYINTVTDLNRHTTNFTKNAFTGGLLTATFPSTPGDTPPNTPRGVVSYTYGSTSCADANNRDANNPYYVCTTTDEGWHVTSYLRDTSKRITQINYPDGGTESFQYNSFGQVTSRTMRTGGVETLAYDFRGLRQTYRDPYHATGNPTFWYQYDGLDRLSGVTDALGQQPGDINHTTNYTYNTRGELLVTTHPPDPGPSSGGSTDAQTGHRYTVTNAYNPDGTLASTTDEESHITSFTYDSYRRLRSVTTAGHNTPVTAYAFYDANGVGEDYSHTDGNPTWTESPSGKKVKNSYDENYRKTSVTQAFGTSDAATTSYGYDNVGNVTSMISPNEQPGELFSGFSTTITYDERNRRMSVRDAQSNLTTVKYDAGGHRASIIRPNGQVTSYDSYDAMNRVLQQTVKQTPDPDAVTKYTYYTSGLLATMKDPRLVAINSAETYAYHYDLVGRQDRLTYPRPDANGGQATELWHYDTVGRVDTFTNRAGNVATLTYDPLSRPTGLSWNDGVTPSVTVGYDVASRPTSIVNSNAAISRAYFNDNLLNTETTTYADNTPRTVTYTYDQDYNRGTIQYPNGAYAFTYQYTGRNQLLNLINNNGNGTVATYNHDKDGNVTYRSLSNGTSSTFTNDVLDRVMHINHSLTGTTRTFDYGYDSVGNRLWIKRDGGNGDVFGHDLNDQSMSILLNVANPDTAAPGPQTINYDANGNRTTFSPYGSTDTYTTNNLNQYTNRNSSTASYDPNGNLSAALDTSTYTYDAQKRLISASKSGTTETFKYDGLSRQVSRTIGAGSPVYNVYDGWTLIGEYAPGATSPTNAYLSGANGLVKNLTTNQYYYQDANGSTSHLADSTGRLLEWYRYDLQGTPIFYNSLNNQISASNYGIRHLFTGQQWYSEIGIYDLRFRAYSPDSGRFLQPDPVRFFGDHTNLYRYVHNNPQRWRDPIGLAGPTDGPISAFKPDPGSEIDYPVVEVNAPDLPDLEGDPTGGSSGGSDGAGVGGEAPEARAEAKAERVVVTGTPVPTDYNSLNQLQTSPTPNPTPTNSQVRAQMRPIIVFGLGLTVIGYEMKNGALVITGLILTGFGLDIYLGVLGPDTGPTPTPTPAPTVFPELTPLKEG
ncbi:MAG TPA: RHS repeat-associated core domain-containing protein [Chthoniobacterales bacterium]|nr:RHS repeat-associated core domain-containing protein [Chthoniobacterales bacterium]